MGVRGKSLNDFEKEHGGSKFSELQKKIRSMAEQRHTIGVTVPNKHNTVQIGVIGDTHFGSLYEAKDELCAFYNLLGDMGINTVLHAGDVLDGHRIYKGQEFELHKLGWQHQLDWFKSVAPRVDGIRTYFITGNHDESFKKLTGIDVGSAIEQARPDWHFLGEESGRITLDASNGVECDIQLLHPDGGTSYALSYRPQKIAEQIEGGNKPDLLIIGHYHKAEWIPQYRNMFVMQSGSFQWQTPFMMRKGASAAVGGWIVNITKADDHNVYGASFVPFYNRRGR